MPKKKEFDWEPGGNLSKDDYDPLGNVREVGFAKLADGIYADPTQRKEARGKKLKSKQRQRRVEGEAPSAKPSEGALPTPLIEESESGLNRDYTPSEASRLIRKDDKGIKGIIRFNKSPKKKDN